MTGGPLLHGPPRWTIVVPPDDVAAHARLSRRFSAAPWVVVILDRRRGNRRQPSEQHVAERRLADRRAERADPGQSRSHRLLQRQASVAIYELMDLGAATDCPICQAAVWFEMPRFSEPPLRLRLQVEHEEVAPKRSRHLVSMEAFGTTDRPLLSFRVAGRVAGEPH